MEVKMDEGLKALVESGKHKGYLTYSQVNDYLPDDHVNPEKLDQLLLVLEEQGKKLPVSYVGRDPLPDTFKDGAQALVEGRVTPDGHFEAEQIQAKCASKYEAAPGSKPTATEPGQTRNGEGTPADSNKS